MSFQLAGRRVQLHVRRMGRGPPLLLVHGLMTSSYSFRYVLEPLSAFFSTYAIDLPGAGRSPPLNDVALTPETMADVIVNAQRALGIEGCLAIGNSLGGYLTLHAAVRHPGTFSRLLVLHAPGLPTFRMRLLALATRLPGSRGLLGALVGKDGRRWTHRNVHYWDESLKSLEEAEEYAAPLRTDEGLNAFYGTLRDTLALGPMRDLARRLRVTPLSIPVLLVYAERDPMVPPQLGTRWAQLMPSARLEWLQNASHFAHVDAVDAFLPRALTFLREAGAHHT